MKPAMSEGSQRDRTGPAIVLVEPQLGENIGTTARAMANFGLTDLRLVEPREGWPNEKAQAAASGADHVLERVRVYPSVEAAVADLGFLYATTARVRDLAKDVAGPRKAAETMRALSASKQVGVLFGRERSGLTNDHVALADAILTLPVDPDFSSLNIAQSVLIIAYEWRLAMLGGEEGSLPFSGPGEEEQAPKEALFRFFEHFEDALERAGFFRPPERKPHMVRALRTLFHRARLTEQEVRTMRGVVAALEARPTRPHEMPDGGLSTARGKARS
jgi:tRNA/rRNA methyltransferase